MMSSDVSIDHLTVADKLLLMERLWEDLSRQPQDIPVPDWQKEILSERIASVREGRATFQDWDEAKKRLRERHR
jgi:putative addiction module component (TIGR02574 family)